MVRTLGHRGGLVCPSSPGRPFPAAPSPRTRAAIRRSARGGQAEIPLATSPAHGEDRGNIATPSPQGMGADIPSCHAKDRISCQHGCIVLAGGIRLRPLQEEHVPLPGALDDDCSAMRDALKDVPGLPGHSDPHTVHSKCALCISNRLLPFDTGPCSPARPDESRPQVFRITAQRPPFGLFALMCGRVETKGCRPKYGAAEPQSVASAADRRLPSCESPKGRSGIGPPRRFHIAARHRQRHGPGCASGAATSQEAFHMRAFYAQIVQSIIGGIE